MDAPPLDFCRAPARRWRIQRPFLVGHSPLRMCEIAVVRQIGPSASSASEERQWLCERSPTYDLSQGARRLVRSKAAGNVCVVWPGWTRRRTGKVARESRAARSGDPGGHPASGRVEGARRAGDGEAQGRRGTCQTGSRACRTGSGACAAGSRGTLGRAGSRRGVGGRSSACSSALLSLGRMTTMCGCVQGRRWSYPSGWRTSISQLSGTPSTATTKSSSTLPSRNAIAS